MLVYIVGRSRKPKLAQVPGVSSAAPAAATAPVGYLSAWKAARGVISCACAVSPRHAAQPPSALNSWHCRSTLESQPSNLDLTGVECRAVDRVNGRGRVKVLNGEVDKLLGGWTLSL